MTATPQTTADSSPAVHILHGQVVVDGLSSNDQTFVAELQALDDAGVAGSVCQEVFELGVSVRRIAGRSADVISLEERIRRAEDTITTATSQSSASIMESVRKAADPDEGDFAQSITLGVDRLVLMLETEFGSESGEGALGRIKDSVTEVMKELASQTVAAVTRIVDPQDENSPMRLLSKEISRDVVQPVTELTTAVREMKEAVEVRMAVGQEQNKGTAKGRSYEAQVQARIEECGSVTGDVVEGVGDVAGADGSSKAGDIVSTLNNAAEIRVVIEAKDTKLSLAKTRTELESAASNRIAQAAIIAFSSEDSSPVAAPFTRLGPGRYVVAYDKDTENPLALRVAYQVARSEALVVSNPTADEVDVEALMAKIDEARSLTTMITKIERGARKAEKGASEVLATSVQLKKQLCGILDDLETLVQDGDSDEETLA